MYLALVWKIFGKTLTVSHFAMLPFLWGIVFFIFKIGERLGGKENAHWLPLLCFADPVLASQSILVSPDVVVVCFFLAAVWAILKNLPPASQEKREKNFFSKNFSLSKNLFDLRLALAIVGLGLISMRGMMLAAGLFLFSLFSSIEKYSWRLILQKILPFVPGGLLAAGYLFLHWQKTGWVGYHAGSPWSPSFERVDLQGFVKNVAVLGWRMVDFGRVFVWAGILACCLFWAKGWQAQPFRKFETFGKVISGSGNLSESFKLSERWATTLAFLLATVFLAIVPTQLFYKGLLAHRYLLPVFLVLTFLFFHLAVQSKFKKPLILLAFLSLATGNFWVYPKNIATGWDSTLAHLPWYDLRQEMLDFLDESKIDLAQVGTAFPSVGDQKFVDLSNRKNGFEEKDLQRQCFIFYANVMNDFTDAEIDELEINWQEIKRLERGGVCLILYKNPNRQCEN